MKSTDSGPLLGLRTAIYRVDDLDRARAWYTDVLGFGPYFDEPFYVGFSVGGYELGLLPVEADAHPGVGGVTVYWGVADADTALARLLHRGAVEHEAVEDVGEGIRVGAVLDPFGNPLGIIENPHFRLPDAE
jgi:predicted enzyme related to lactoylglutathione lyase